MPRPCSLAAADSMASLMRVACQPTAAVPVSLSCRPLSLKHQRSAAPCMSWQGVSCGSMPPTTSLRCSLQSHRPHADRGLASTSAGWLTSDDAQTSGFGASLQRSAFHPASRLHAVAKPVEEGVAEGAVESKGEEEKEQQEGEGEWQVKMLFDGDCPLCMREVNFLRERNKEYNAIKFVDISSEDYSPEENAGIPFEVAMGHIHAINRDGTVLTSIDAFRRFYEVVGLGWVYAITKYKPVAAVADAVYEFWAKYRLPITGRPSIQAVLDERRRQKEGEVGCKPEEPCEVEW